MTDRLTFLTRDHITVSLEGFFGEVSPLVDFGEAPYMPTVEQQLASARERVGSVWVGGLPIICDQPEMTRVAFGGPQQSPPFRFMARLVMGENWTTAGTHLFFIWWQKYGVHEGSCPTLHESLTRLLEPVVWADKAEAYSLRWRA